MSDIDTRLDKILADRMWFIEQELNVGQNVQDVLHNAKDELQDKIKKLMADEFEKMIGEDDKYDALTIDSDYDYAARNQLRKELRQKLKEWKQ
jgi:hypothetical protein